MSKFECKGVELRLGDGRNLSWISPSTIDLIVTDHPWLDEVSHSGGNRNYATYDCFRYTQQDFVEKARVLREGCFCVEFIPDENENNWEYLYQIKKMAQTAGFQYYSQIFWHRGDGFNVGRKSKAIRPILVFSKGKARPLRKDNQRGGYMSGVDMLPALVYFEPIKNGLYPNELPVSLLTYLVTHFSLPGEIALDQFAGSGSTGIACMRNSRNCILIDNSEIAYEIIMQRMAAERGRMNV